jgi:phenol 2-monooxygenase
MEMFEAYGFSERVLKEACWINETTFWKPDDQQRGNIVRSGSGLEKKGSWNENN